MREQFDMQHLHLEEKMTRSYTGLHLAAEHELFAGVDNKCAMLEQTTAENTVKTTNYRTSCSHQLWACF